jgi:TRAP-type C4-dicarboxylate transport system permease small subunit
MNQSMSAQPEPASTTAGGRERHAALVLIESLTAAMAITGVGMLGLAIGLVVVDIVWRRLMGGAVVGVIDLSQLCVMAAAFWSIPYAFTKQAHVAVDFLPTDHAPRLRIAVALLAVVLGVGLLGLLLGLGFGRAMDAWRSKDISEDLGIPMVSYWFFLISGLAVAIVATVAAGWREMQAARVSGEAR